MIGEPDKRRAVAGRQLAMELALPPALGRSDFLVAPSNRAAAEAVLDPARWLVPRLALVGPEASGKSHLVRIWAAETGACVLPAAALRQADAPALATRALALEDADRALAAERVGQSPAHEGLGLALLHLHNLMAERGTLLLLTARRPPAGWTVGLADLASRLAALPVASIGAPDDAFLSSLAIKLCRDRQLRVHPEVVGSLLCRIERSHAAVAAAVEALDKASLAERRTITRGLAIEVLRRLGHN